MRLSLGDPPDTVVSAEDRDDRIIRERRFRMGGNIDIADIDVGSGDSVSDSVEATEKEPELDEALGDVFDPFSAPSGKDPGAVQRDGSVQSAPESDLVTTVAREGEKRVNWSLMVAMIFVFSALSVVAGTTFPPAVSLLILLALAAVGFSLGERWVPNRDLHILGVTWVIISMKVLYGLAVELNRWELGPFLPISVEMLAVLLLALVALNVFVAYRHNHDAIAAQATLVLLAIASTAGSVGGEIGVAVMILVATLLLHSIALHRNSGNLAALGIAASNLWIGMHALTGGFEAGSLRILPLETPLLLFLLLMLVTGVNASMAARFAREENWFSLGFQALGLGKPGLWGVSISMGMVGALLAVASSREDVGYALGMVTFLGAAFGGSYLVVRGVERDRVALPLLAGGMALSLLLLLGDSSESVLPLDRYESFTVFAALITGFVMLRDQDRVSDRVLWLGSIAVLILLVILVPAESKTDGGDGGVMLLAMLAALHLGTGTLAIKRNAPALAGVTVLLPWSWILVEELLQEAIRTVLVANNRIDPGSIIDLSPEPLVVYLGLAAILMLVVNLRMGETGVNLASGFLGITEISASIRDSGILQLWSMGLWLPLITVVVMSQLGGFTAVTLLAITALLCGLHLAVEFSGRRLGDPVAMLAMIAVGLTVLQWRHGLDSMWMIFVTIAAATILLRAGVDEEAKFTQGMALMSLPILATITSKNPMRILAESDELPSLEPAIIAVVCMAAILLCYLPRAAQMENLLKPALAALWLICITIGLAMQEADSTAINASIAIFAATSIWLVARGEIRSELKSLARRDARLVMAGNADEALLLNDKGAIAGYDPRLAELEAKRAKRRDLKATDDLDELYITDVSHRPTIVLVILTLILGVDIVWGFVNGPSPMILLVTGIFATILVAIARLRTRGLELELPNFLGLEMPIALAICGIVAAHVAGHLGPAGSKMELLDMAVVTILVLELVVISLWNQDNLLDRIPIAIDWFVLPLLIGRTLGVLMVESLPAPFTVNPFDGPLIDWKMPWLLLEGLLILAVLTDSWIDARRTSVGRDSHNGSTGRGARTYAYVLLSWGPAGILAVANAVYQGRKHEQVEAVGLALLAVPLALISISNLHAPTWELIPESTYFLGLLMLALVAASILTKNGHWTMMAAIDSHILIIVGTLALGQYILIPITLILASTTLWVVGILHLRKVLRIWGLVDLIAAVIIILLLFGPASLGAGGLFLLLAVVGAELALVTWLGQRNEEALLQD